MDGESDSNKATPSGPRSFSDKLGKTFLYVVLIMLFMILVAILVISAWFTAENKRRTEVAQSFSRAITAQLNTASLTNESDIHRIFFLITGKEPSTLNGNHFYSLCLAYFITNNAELGDQHRDGFQVVVKAYESTMEVRPFTELPATIRPAFENIARNARNSPDSDMTKANLHLISNYVLEERRSASKSPWFELVGIASLLLTIYSIYRTRKYNLFIKKGGDNLEVGVHTTAVPD